MAQKSSRELTSKELTVLKVIFREDKENTQTLNILHTQTHKKESGRIGKAIDQIFFLN